MSLFLLQNCMLDLQLENINAKLEDLEKEKKSDIQINDIYLGNNF